MLASTLVAEHSRAPGSHRGINILRSRRPELTAVSVPGRLAHRQAATACVVSAPALNDSVTTDIRAGRYDRVLIAADFADTADTFHRRLVRVAQRLAPCVELLQFATDGDNTQPDISTEILLEGLLHRLGIGAKTCAIVPPCPLRLALCRNAGDHNHQLLLFGRSMRQRLHPTCMNTLVDHARAFGCDLITIDDASDADY